MDKLIGDIHNNSDTSGESILFSVNYIKKLSKFSSPEELKEKILILSRELKKRWGTQASLNFIYRTELALKIRKPKLAIYDHAFHFIGGAQKYGISMVKAVEHLFEITIISNRNVTHSDFREWYNIDTSDMEIKIVPIPFFENAGTFHIEPHRITKSIKNPFHIISRESGNYDIFINNGMLEMVYPLSPVSVMVCHFPERRPQSYFYSDLYTHTVYNSNYTGEWIKQRWKYTPHKRIYPPVDMSPRGKEIKKENIILSVARFEEGGTKKQYEMIKAFSLLRKRYPDDLKQWRFLLVGGCQENSGYLRKLDELIKNETGVPVEIMVNISEKELREIYGKSKIFWHICGLGQNDPAKIEHFGMTIAEAMQNGVVPIVFNGGGQKEIVDKTSGFRIGSVEGLISGTLALVRDDELRKKLSSGAKKRSEQFNISNFNKRVADFFGEILLSL